MKRWLVGIAVAGVWGWAMFLYEFGQVEKLKAINAETAALGHEAVELGNEAVEITRQTIDAYEECLLELAR